MKHLILAAALLGATATTSLAQSKNWPAPPTATEVQTLKQDIIAKRADLQANIQGNKKIKAEGDAADMLKMMRKHVVGTRNTAEANGGTTRDQILAHMLTLENSVMLFMRSDDDVIANGTALMTIVDDFITNF